MCGCINRVIKTIWRHICKYIKENLEKSKKEQKNKKKGPIFRSLL